MRSPDDAPRHAYNRRMGRDRTNHHRPGAHFNVVADLNIAEDARARADHHAVSDGGMALAGRFPSASERYALIEQHVVADFRRLADHHPHAVVDEQTPADPGAGMNLDSRQASRELAQHPGQREPSRTV